MQHLTDGHLETLIVQSYANAYAYHGDLGLEPDVFLNQLNLIIERRLGVNPPPYTAFDLVNSLYVNDLYLTLACSQANEIAWGRFVSLYMGVIRRRCRRYCPSSAAASELADSLLGQLFLPDATGCSRIASYKGFSSLVVWLVAIIKHCAVSEQRLRPHYVKSIDQVPDIADHASIPKIEAAIRADKYEQLIRDSIQGAISFLTDRERFILRLRYEQQLQVSQVALLMGVKSPAISRQLDRTRQKLRQQVIFILSTKHQLGPAVIQECLTDILENPEHRIPILS